MSGTRCRVAWLVVAVCAAIGQAADSRRVALPATPASPRSQRSTE